MSSLAAAGLNKLKSMAQKAKGRFNPSQPRDAHGRWTSGGSDSLDKGFGKGFGKNTAPKTPKGAKGGSKKGVLSEVKRVDKKVAAKQAEADAKAREPKPGVLPEKFESAEQAQIWLQKTHPHLKVNYSGIDTASAEATTREFHALAQEYPSVAKKIQYIGTNRPPWERLTPGYIQKYGLDDQGGLALGKGNAMAYNNPSTGDRCIGINPVNVGDFERFNRMKKYSQEKGWNPKNSASGLQSVVAHEFGHHVDYALDDIAAKSPAFKVFRQRVDGFSKAEGLHKEVSGYAATNMRELFAEGFLQNRYGTGGETNYGRIQKFTLAVSEYADKGEKIPFGELAQKHLKDMDPQMRSRFVSALKGEAPTKPRQKAA